MSFPNDDRNLPVDGYVPEIEPMVPAPEVPESPEPPVSTGEPFPEAEPDPIEEARQEVLEAFPVLEEADYFPDGIPEKPQSRLKAFWQAHKLFVILTSIFLILACTFIGIILQVYLVIKPYDDYDYILPNVYCAGVDLSGMTRKEAQEAIEEALRNPSYTVTLKLPDCEYVFAPEQEGVTLNGAVIAQKAYEYLREDTSAYGMYKAYHEAKRNDYYLDAETDLIYSIEDIEAMAQTIYEETYIEATPSTAENDTENHTVTVNLGVPGRMIDPEDIVSAVDQAFADMIFEDITLDYEPVEIDLVALWELAKQAEKDYSFIPVDPTVTANYDAHTIDVIMGTPGYSLTANDLYLLAKENVTSGEYGSVTLQMTETRPVDVDIVPAYHELACDPVEPYYYYGEIIESSYGYTLDWEYAVNTILESTWGQSLSVDMTPIAPKKTAAEVRAVLFRDRMGSYSSPHTAIANRTHNLTLACQAINGTVINPGEVFSFNGVVGQRTAEKGYREATVYVGTESVGELGGGICQVASTIYNAALYADLEIVYRSPHIYYVTYVKGGLDATVYWGSLDFKFRNDTEYPIRINASVSGGYVHISIDGTKVNDNYVVLSSTRLSTTPYSVVTEYTSSLPAGVSKETVSPYTGYVYEAYQYVYAGDGTLLETNYLGKSRYEKRDQVISVGTG